MALSAQIKFLESMEFCIILILSGEIEERDVSADGKVPLEDLCRRAIDVSLQKNLTTNHAVSQASTLSNALQGIYRQKEKALLTVQNAEAKNCALTRLQILLTAHSWYHEDILQESFNTNLTTKSKLIWDCLIGFDGIRKQNLGALLKKYLDM